MKLDKLNIAETIENARKLLEADEQITPALKAMVQLLITIITLLAAGLGLNSRNSSKPPSTDPNRGKKGKGGNGKPGGQPGRTGTNLEPVENPDTIIPIKLDKRHLPRGKYWEVGFESRQVVDIEISRIVTEYQAQILEDAKGKRFVAAFPQGVTRPIQYGKSVRAHAVYLSQYQLIPYERVADYFVNEARIPLSVGSLFNFNQDAYDLLETFDALARRKLIESLLLHADETGINVNGKRYWLHTACNARWTYFSPHEKRGAAAMDEAGILPEFRGVLVHDHWKPYYTYQSCMHGLCNAHHIRELQWVIDNHPRQSWVRELQQLLLDINEAVNNTEDNRLDSITADEYRRRYRVILDTGEKEVPLPPPDIPKKRGRQKKTKERNLLERLRDFEEDVLRFMEVSYVPFTNNRGENDIRMTKVQQKISGCFKSLNGAKIFCRVRSYLLTAQKHGITPTDALKTLFHGKLPDVFFTE